MYSSSGKRKNRGKQSLKAARMRIGSMTPDSSRRSRSNSRRRSALKRDMAKERYETYLRRNSSKDKKKRGTTRKNGRVGASRRTRTKESSKNQYAKIHRAAPVRTERWNKDNLTILVTSKNMNTLGMQLKNKGFIEVRTTRAGTLFKHPAIERVAKKAAVSDADIDRMEAEMDAIAGIGRIEEQIKEINKKQNVNDDDFDALIGNLESVKIAADSADDLTSMMATLRA